MSTRRLICAVVIAAASGWAVAARGQDEVLLSSFETDADIAAWGKDAQRSAEHATHGAHSAKVVNDGTSYAGIGSANPKPSDWSGYDVMAVDVLNPQGEPVTFAIRIDDSQSRDYGSRYNRENFTCPPGRSTFELNITGIPTSNRLDPRKMDVANLKLISIFTLPGKPVTLYFDNLRLVKKETVAVAGLRAFDLGPKDAPLYPGFTKVTRDTMYDAAAGFGWKYRANYERNEDHPNALFGDWVHGSCFLVDLPPGEYEVYMMLECPGQWNYYQNWKMRRVEAEGRAVVDETMDAETFLREYYYHFQDDEDLPDQDTWDKYIMWRYKPKRFRARVDDGQLDLVLRDEGRGVPMSTLIIWPTGSDAQASRWLDKLHAGMKKEFDTMWLKVEHKETNTLDAVGDELAGKKYVLFARDYGRGIYYNTVPAPEEITDTVGIAAARGEYEPFYFGVLPLDDLGETRVEVTDLAGPGGATIPGGEVDIKKVQYRQRRGAGSYTFEPSLLKDFDAVDIRKGVTRGFWGTVRVGKDTPPGRYEGTITVRPAGATERKLRLSVEVLPVDLLEPDISLGILIGIPGYSVWYPEMEKTWWRDLDLIMRDLRAHGMTCYCGGRGPVFKGVEGGEAVIDFAEADRTMELARAAGFSLPGDSYQGFNVRGLERADPAKLREQARKYGLSAEEFLKKVYSRIMAHAKEAGWLKTYFYLCDEPRPEFRNIPPTIEMARLYRAAVPDVPTSGYFGGGSGREELARYYHCSTIHYSPEIPRIASEHGNETWLYNQGWDRLTFGAYAYKVRSIGIKGMTQFAYQITQADPYYDLDSVEGASCVAFPSREGLVDTVPWERIREGVDDLRYLIALEKAAEANPDSPAAAKAREFFGKHFAAPVERFKADLRERKVDLEDLRAQAARMIIELEGEGEGVPAAEAPRLEAAKPGPAGPGAAPEAKPKHKRPAERKGVSPLLPAGVVALVVAVAVYVVVRARKK